MPDLRMLLVSGSTRTGSSNTLVLRKLHALQRPGVSTECYDGLVSLPAFVPDQQPQPDAVRSLLDRIRHTDAVVLSTPEYAGGLPGTLKNLLDWTVGGGELYGKPVAWLDVANPGRGAGAREQLRTVLGYVGARIVDAACVHVDLDRDTATATVTEAQQLTAALEALAAAARGRRDEPGDAALDRVRIAWYDGDRAALRASFEQAEDSQSRLDAYIDEGRVLVAWQADRLAGHLQLVDTGRTGEAEVKNMAVAPALRGTGIGRRLVETALAAARADGYARTVVATAAAGVGILRFYQRCGFRFAAIEADAFTADTGYPDPIVVDGVPLRDRVWLAQQL